MGRDFKVRPSVNGANVLVAGDTVSADTELPAAAALADGAANPTTPSLGAAGLVFNGSTWDRMRGDADGLVMQGNAASGDPDTGAPIKVGGVYNATPPLLNDGDRGDLQLNNDGALRVSGTYSGASGLSEFSAEMWTTADAVTGEDIGFNHYLHVMPTGDVASGAADAGNPVKVGGVYNSTLPTLDEGDRGDLQVTALGDLRVSLSEGGPVFFGLNNGLAALPVAGGYVPDEALPATRNNQPPPLLAGGIASLAAPSDVSADGDAALLWLSRKGAAVVDGGVASGAADAGNPVKVGGLATNLGLSAAVDYGDRVEAVYDRWGMQYVIAAQDAGDGKIGLTCQDGYTGELMTRAGGTVAAGSPDTGWPVKVGGLYAASLPTLDDGDRGNLQLSDRGVLYVEGPGFTDSGAASSTELWTASGEIVGGATIGFFHHMATMAQGNVASGAVDSGNPVKVGGRYNSTPPTLTNGQRGDLQLDVDGALRVTHGTLEPLSVAPTNSVGETFDAFPIASGLIEGHLNVGGNVAAGNPDGGRPVKVGGVYDATPQTLTDGDRGDLMLDSVGRLHVADGGGSLTVDGTVTLDSATLTALETVTVGGSVALDSATLTALETITADTELPAAAALADAASNPTAPSVGSAGLNWNGTGWDRLRSLDALKTESGSPDVGIPAVNLADRRFSSVNLGTVVGNTQAWDCMGADAAMIFVGTSTTGTFLFEVTADGSTWQSAEVRLTGNDAWQSGVAQTPASGNAYRVLTAGYRSVRARTVTTLGATVALITTLAADTVMLMALKTGPAPHNIGYSLTSKTAQYTTIQSTAADLWTPASGKKVVVTSYQIQAGGTTAGSVQLWFGASGDTSYTRATDLAIFDGEFAPSATLKPGVVQTGCWPASAVDHRLKVQDSAAINPLTVTVWGYEV